MASRKATKLARASKASAFRYKEVIVAPKGMAQVVAPCVVLRTYGELPPTNYVAYRYLGEESIHLCEKKKVLRLRNRAPEPQVIPPVIFQGTYRGWEEDEELLEPPNFEEPSCTRTRRQSVRKGLIYLASTSKNGSMYRFLLRVHGRTMSIHNGEVASDCKCTPISYLSVDPPRLENITPASSYICWDEDLPSIWSEPKIGDLYLQFSCLTIWLQMVLRTKDGTIVTQAHVGDHHYVSLLSMLVGEGSQKYLDENLVETGEVVVRSSKTGIRLGRTHDSVEAAQATKDRIRKQDNGIDIDTASWEALVENFEFDL